MSTSAPASIHAIVEREAARLRAMGEPAVSRRPSPTKWCPKEILGHLVDSALNNAQRFVRGQLAAELVFPGYEQERWVAVQDYASADWQGLVVLWTALNSHIAHIVGRIPQEKLSTPCRIGEAVSVPLEAVIQGYITHVEHHLGQM